jgi:hypothetical protein
MRSYNVYEHHMLSITTVSLVPWNNVWTHVYIEIRCRRIVLFEFCVVQVLSTKPIYLSFGV